MQGMPVDRMVSEIARRVPSGGGIGLGIPIMGGGGGGGDAEAAGDVGEGEVAAGDMAADTAEGASVSDAAVEADRAATVASSGMLSDPHSSEGLFGDAAHPSSPSGLEPTSDGMESEHADFSGSDDFAQQGIEFEEPSVTDQSFEDDGTTFSTYEDESTNDAATDVPSEEGPGLLGQLWDFFTDDE